MKEKNLAVELLKKLIAEQVSVYRRTNVVKSEKFSEIMQRSLNAYLNGMLTNEEVIEEMLKLAKQIAAAQKEGDKLGLTADEGYGTCNYQRIAYIRKPAGICNL